MSVPDGLLINCNFTYGELEVLKRLLLCHNEMVKDISYKALALGFMPPPPDNINCLGRVLSYLKKAERGEV